MKRIIVFYILCLSFVKANTQDILPVPNPPRLVTDKAAILSTQQVEILEQKLVALDDTSSNQIAIVAIQSLNGYDVADYANKLFRDWKIGNKKTNNGVLILVAPNERRIRIEVGYGLEGAIPDITANDIIDNIITPRFKEGNFYAGLDGAVDALSAAAVGEYKVRREREEGGDGISLLVFIIIMIIILMLVGRGGGRGGGMMSRRGYRGWNNVPPIWIGGGGGGGGWSGGGGGGGFGGFGGGGGGGGGASGGW